MKNKWWNIHHNSIAQALVHEDTLYEYMQLLHCRGIWAGFIASQKSLCYITPVITEKQVALINIQHVLKGNKDLCCHANNSFVRSCSVSIKGLSRFLTMPQL